MSIDHDIPIPAANHWDGTIHCELREAYAKMSVGDSFVYPNWIKNMSNFYRAARTEHIRIRARKLAKGGFRIWRVA